MTGLGLSLGLQQRGQVGGVSTLSDGDVRLLLDGVSRFSAGGRILNAAVASGAAAVFSAGGEVAA